MKTTPQSNKIVETKCMSMRWNAFSKPQIFNPSFSKESFSHSPYKFSSKQNVLHITQGIFKLDWSNQKHTQLHVQYLAKSNLCSMCKLVKTWDICEVIWE